MAIPQPASPDRLVSKTHLLQTGGLPIPSSCELAGPARLLDRPPTDVLLVDGR